MHPPPYYHRLRSRFTPAKPSLILIAESPPVSGKYFYDTTGRVGESLFIAIMKSILKMRPESKEKGLIALKDNGVVLLDATYTQINSGYSEKQKASIILDGYSELLSRINETTQEKAVPVLLIKMNICRCLEPLLTKDGYNVINRGVAVPFPCSGNQRKFAAAIEEILGRSDLSVTR